MLSARRADHLLRENLFDRVYAVRVPGFARLFGKAELDMHFSLKEDLRDLHGFLKECERVACNGRRPCWNVALSEVRLPT